MDDPMSEEVIDRSQGKWYVLHTLSGQENRVREKIENQIRIADADIPIFEVLIPTETVSEVRNGTRRKIKRKIFPGYVYVRMNLYTDDERLNQRAWYFVREVQGVIGFISGGDTPLPLPDEEVSELLRQSEEMEEGKGTTLAKVPAYVSIGANVRIVDGAFVNFKGSVEEIDMERGKLKLLVSIFGRSTPVELEFWQVGPDED